MASTQGHTSVSSRLVEEILGLGQRALDRARISRDPRFDGKFFIAVKSTGIYCRPICPSPTSKIGNVRYYPTAAAAAEAGYRPCLRCRPEAAPGTPAWLGTSAVVRRALRFIDEGFLDQQSVEKLADRLGIGARHLHRLFVQHVGASPITVAQTRRLHFAKRLLDETKLPITEIALAAGFGSLRRFNSAFRQTYARAPRDLRRQRQDGPPSQTGNEVVMKLAFRRPYDWEQVRDFLALRAVPGVERVDARGYARTVAAGAGHAVICVRPLEQEAALELRVSGAPLGALFQLSSAARRTFDLAADPVRIALAFRSDPLLAPLVRRRPGLRIPGAWDPFECAVRAILGQQVSVAAGRTLASRLVARIGQSLSTGEERLTHLFPTPAALADADLRGMGLTQARIGALQALGKAVVSGELSFQGSVEEVTGALMSLPGVGDWTAQYVALRALSEPDAFLAADIVLRRMAAKNGTPLTAPALEARAEAWRPWRGYAVMHLWRSAAEVARPRVVPAWSADAVEQDSFVSASQRTNNSSP
jgi:AraC family transcriptional regulator, regulatory protein of adaptative response / DNA-3-methyladenine glycosylase II